MEEREEKKGERKEERKGEEMTENASLLSKVEIRFLISSIHACPSPPLTCTVLACQTHPLRW